MGLMPGLRYARCSFDGLVKSPPAALRCNFVVAAHLASAIHSSVFARLACRGELHSPIMGVRLDAPTIETIVLVIFYEIIEIYSELNSLAFAFEKISANGGG